MAVPLPCVRVAATTLGSVVRRQALLRGACLASAAASKGRSGHMHCLPLGQPPQRRTPLPGNPLAPWPAPGGSKAAGLHPPPAELWDLQILNPHLPQDVPRGCGCAACDVDGHAAGARARCCRAIPRGDGGRGSCYADPEFVDWASRAGRGLKGRCKCGGDGQGRRGRRAGGWDGRGLRR